MTTPGPDDAGRDHAPGPDQAPPPPAGDGPPHAAAAGPAPGPVPGRDPFAAPEPWPGSVPPAPSGVRERAARVWQATRGDVVAALVVIAACLVAGLAVGLVWAGVAPRVELVATAGGEVYGVAPESESAIGQDGWFAVCGVVAGLVLAVPAYRWGRRRGLGTAIGLAAGGLAGGWLAFRFGTDVLGPGPVLEQARKAGPGVRFDQPLDLRAKGVLYLWPIASLIVYLALSAGFTHDDDRYRRAYGPPQGPPGYGPPPYGPPSYGPPAPPAQAPPAQAP